jgi:hypothetical protein
LILLRCIQLFLYLAAEKALRSFSDLPFQLPDDTLNESETTTTTTATTLNIDSDGTIINPTSSIENNDQIQGTIPSPNVAEPREIQSGLSPLYLLNQLKRDAQYEAILNDESSALTNEQHEFKMVVIVDGQRFLGSGRSKRIAKTKAAQLALEKLFGMCFDKEGNKNSTMHKLINSERLLLS